MPEPDGPVLLGVRHHGPGSARAVRRALEAYRPEVLLIEGPPEADALVRFAASEQMRPPVALLAYTTDDRSGRRAAYWPFAEFSPEWQAIRWALDADVPVQFCDLPGAVSLASTRRRAPEDSTPGEPDGPKSEEEGESGGESEGEPKHEQEPSEGSDKAADELRSDPIGLLARAAGYDDPERWWEDMIEHRRPADGDDLEVALAPFQAVAEAMAAVRAAAPTADAAEVVEEARREAHMRTVLRAATKRYGRVAVVCGAWHVPALTAPLPTAKADAEVLKGLPKRKVHLTWVPWTHGRLASWQGYGAGVSSPGWYHHLFTVPDRPVTRWLVGVAGVLRDEGQPVSSAHVIEAVRLAEALARMRGRPLAGLGEVSEATRAVLCDGDELRLALVNRRLVVGERLGAVPDDTPSMPLVADLTARQRRLRMRPSPLESDLDLDLRRDIDAERSRLLHRLRLLGVEWGAPAAEHGGGRRGLGTFWESWRLCWRPEFAVDLVEAGGYGTTVVGAATAKAAELAAQADSLERVAALVERCLLADLRESLPVVLKALDERVALDADVSHLMAALPALARTLRYGDVRGTDVTALGAVTHGLVIRVCVGLPGAVARLDDSAALQMHRHVDAVHAALGLIADMRLTEEWLATLERVVARDDLHGLLAGRVTRLLLDAGRLEADEAGRRLGLVLTVGVEPARAAAWIEGFLSGGGLLLVHDERLLSLVDGWLTAIPDETFTEVLPLLRRTFATFEAPERRSIGERVRRLDAGGGARREPEEELDHDRAAAVLPTLRLLLGRDDLGVTDLGVTDLGVTDLGVTS
jgi:hypothetical protein